MKNTIKNATDFFISITKFNRYLKKGLIKIIPKTGKDLKVIGDWRPITLLSQIYKVISGAMANRFKKLLPKLISSSQKAYQSDKNIGEILLDIMETISILRYHKKPAMILFIDFSKAFDSISHNFIYDTLRFLNFGEHFIDIVKTMLTNRKCTVMIDGYETDPINIERGVPQGDTPSPFIFIIVLEILLLRIRYDPTLIPIKLEIADHKPIDGGNLHCYPIPCIRRDI